jgi:hypothetical protein
MFSEVSHTELRVSAKRPIHKGNESRPDSLIALLLRFSNRGDCGDIP